MKRYVFFIPTLSQGGGERVISLLSRKMAQKGLPVSILLYKDAEPFYTIDPKVKLDFVCRETGSGNLLKNLFWMRRYFKEHADVVISFLAPFNILALTAMLGSGRTVIVADRNDPRFIPANPIIRKIRDLLYHTASGVIVQTRHNLEYFSASIRKKARILYNPVDMGEKAGLALRVQKQKEIVTVGRLMPQKNQVLLLEAFARISEDYPDYRLTIYGEGPHRTVLEETVRKLHLEEKVSLPGAFKDIHQRISGSSLFVLSSHYEGMPNALIEAMCLGLPVISTAVSGATDLIQSGENGLLVPCGDVDALAGAMAQLLSDEDKRRSFGQEATKVNALLHIDDITESWLEAVAHYSR